VEAEFSHLPVMVREVVELLSPVPEGLIVDCTVGGAGHATALLDARPDLRSSESTVTPTPRLPPVVVLHPSGACAGG